MSEEKNHCCEIISLSSPNLFLFFFFVRLGQKKVLRWHLVYSNSADFRSCDGLIATPSLIFIDCLFIKNICCSSTEWSWILIDFFKHRVKKQWLYPFFTHDNPLSDRTTAPSSPLILFISHHLFYDIFALLLRRPWANGPGGAWISWATRRSW